MIGVEQLSPGDRVTVKHSEYAAYDVTATLIAFPRRGPDGEVRYELNITATDSEPTANEDFRTAAITEISLTDSQVSSRGGPSFRPLSRKSKSLIKIKGGEQSFKS
jgi:hypothetical protein